MQSVQVPSAGLARHTISPADYKTVVLARRIKASDSIANLLAELCYGAHREHVAALPTSTSGRR